MILSLTFLANLQAAAMSQKTEQAEKEAAELRLKLQSTKKDLQGSQHELDLIKHALERANSSLGAARLEQQRLQTQLDARVEQKRLQTQLDAAPESPLEPQEVENALAHVEKLTNNHEVSDRDRHLKNRH
jgi:chromosome segregation ATPase